MTSRERMQAVMGGELPDRVPLAEISFDQRIIGQLIGRDLPAGNTFVRPLESGRTCGRRPLKLS